MSVDIRLCGNLTRKDMAERLSFGGAPCSLSALASQNLNTPCLAASKCAGTDCSTLHKTSPRDNLSNFMLQRSKNKSIGSVISQGMMRNVVPDEVSANSPHLEPPSWAEPAKGEARLEPVCESLGRQSAIDLTTKSSFRVGRSPNSDIQLMHATSSRRHAMLFHHSNGSCYVVDCGSAHGTFVNGKRVAPPSTNGVVIPHKVRRGAIVRFGGPGAPCFVLKSFSFKLEDIKDLSAVSQDMGVLVRRNTRLNALGQTAAERVRDNLSSTIDEALNVFRKRSFDTLVSHETIENDEPCYKRMRCSSPPLSPEAPFRLVSPDSLVTRTAKARRVTFSPEPPQCFPNGLPACD